MAELNKLAELRAQIYEGRSRNTRKKYSNTFIFAPRFTSSYHKI